MVVPVAVVEVEGVAGDVDVTVTPLVVLEAAVLEALLKVEEVLGKIVAVADVDVVKALVLLQPVWRHWLRMTESDQSRWKKPECKGLNARVIGV